MQPLTDEERRILVDELRNLRPAYNLPPVVTCEKAADEIERLAERVAAITAKIKMQAGRSD